MDYTFNYHLPQWAETDRVMRTDFNSAMSNIDGGIADNRDAIQSLELTTTESLNSTVQAAEDRAFGSLFRHAYNHYHLAAAKGLPRQIGLFHQVMDQAALPSNATGFLQREGFAWLAKGTKTATADDLKASVTEVSPLTVSISSASKCTNMVLTFTAPATMLFERFQVSASASVGSTGTKGPLRYTVQDLTTGTTVTNRVMELGLGGSSMGNLTAIIPLNTYIYQDHQYRVEVEPLEIGYSTTLRFSDSTTTYVQARSLNYPAGTVSHTFAESEESRGGLVLVRYNSDAPGGIIALDWDGVIYTPSKTLPVTMPDGRTYQEAEFRRLGTVPARSNLLLQMNALESGGLYLYSWGAVLI